MSTPVVTVDRDGSVDRAEAILVSRGFAAVPVVAERGELVGIVEEADLVRGRVIPDGWLVDDDVAAARVRDVMTALVFSCGPDGDVADVTATMLDRRIRAVPVVRDGRVVGIVTRRDVLRAVAGRRLRAEQVADKVGMASHERG